MIDLTIIAALVAGLLSFLSPCIFPLVPGMIGYLSGSNNTRTNNLINSIFFVFGFSTVFSIFGVLLNTVLGSSSYVVQEWLSRVGGFIIILFGLSMTGIINISFLKSTKQLKVKKYFSVNYFNSFIFGASFAIGWSPCVGSVLGSVFALAISNPGTAFLMLIAYSFGLGLPFILVGIFSKEVIILLKKYSGYMKWFSIVVGILLIILGLLVFTQTIGIVSNFFYLV